jgi:hypothetical protein
MMHSSFSAVLSRSLRKSLSIGPTRTGSGRRFRVGLGPREDSVFARLRIGRKCACPSRGDAPPLKTQFYQNAARENS